MGEMVGVGVVEAQPLEEGLREGEGEVLALRVALVHPEGLGLAEGQREEEGDTEGVGVACRVVAIGERLPLVLGQWEGEIEGVALKV